MKKAVAYVRVSSKEQKQEGYSIPAQKKLLLDYARANGFVVVADFEDDETAKSSGRKGFGEMTEYLQKHKDVESVLVEKTDRLYRNFKDYVTIDELGVTVFLVKENEKIGRGASSHQKFMHGIKVLMAKNYVDNLSEEIKKGLDQKAESGVFPGSNVPIGYATQRVDGKSFPIIDESYKLLAQRMFNLYATGLYSLESLLAKLREEGVLSEMVLSKKKRLKRYTKSSLYHDLRNPFYYGYFQWNGKLYKGSHEPLISKELWDKVQNMLDRFKNKKLAAKYNTIQFPYKGVLTCGECNRTIVGERKIKKNGKVYHYYRCTKFETNCTQGRYTEKEIDDQIAESLKGLELTEETVAFVAEGLKDSLYLKRETEDRTRKLLEEEKAKLQHRLSVLYEDKLDGNINQDMYNQKFAEYSQRILELDGKISKYTKADINYYQLGVNILELAKKAYLIYQKANTQEKQELLNFLLLDSQLKDGKVLINYKRPFDRVFERTKSSDWWT